MQQGKATQEIDQMLASGSIRPEEHERLRAAIEASDQLGRGKKQDPNTDRDRTQTQQYRWPWWAMIGFGIYISLMLTALHAVSWIITDKLVSIFDQLGVQLPTLAILVIQTLRFLRRVYYFPVALFVVGITFGYGRIPEKAMRRVYGRCVTGVIMIAGGVLFVGLCSYLWRMADHVPWE